jgi:hypothetical protein
VQPSSSNRLAIGGAYAAAILFAIRFVFFIPALAKLPIAPQDGTLPGAILAIAEHMVLFPVVAALPAPQWAKAAGYGWLVTDMSTDIMALNGVPNTIFLSLRYGGHISAALWMISASWFARGATRIVGWLTALDLGSYSFLAAYGVNFVALIPSGILLPLWCAMVGRHLSRAGQASQMPAQTEKHLSSTPSV